MTAPAVDLATLKDDLGIPASDTTQDAWLERRIAGVWSAFEEYTGRRLSVPPAQFMDDWGDVVLSGRRTNLPPVLAFPQRASVYLRLYPVTSIDAVENYGAAGNPADVSVEEATGKIVSLQASVLGDAYDCGQTLLGNRAKITYHAGWETMPAELYEALLGVLQELWKVRAAQTGSASGGLAGVGSITAIDVGTVELDAGNTFVQSATRYGGPGLNPLLGPWTSLLDPYRDFRGKIGGTAYASTTEVEAPPPPGP